MLSNVLCHNKCQKQENFTSSYTPNSGGIEEYQLKLEKINNYDSLNSTKSYKLIFGNVSLG